MTHEKYISEITYSAGYYDAMNTGQLEFVLALSGLSIETPKTACELGFGKGISLVYHAASSDVAWYGTDLLAEHVKFARQLSSTAGLKDNLSNVDLKNYKQQDLPQFDFIALHGVWSWVSADTRSDIIDFISAKLKPGGSVYISYNLLPGQAHILPFRELFYSTYKSLRSQSADTPEAIKLSLLAIQRLIQANPKFFESQPEAKEHFLTVCNQSPNYLAHEYLNGTWEPMFFTRIYDLLTDIGLSHVCSSHLLDSISNFSMSQEQIATVEATEGYSSKELARDTITNRQFRREYWTNQQVHNGDRLDPDLNALEFRIMQAVPTVSIKLKITCDAGLVTLDKTFYTAFLNELANYKTPSIKELMQKLQSAGYSSYQVVEALKILLSCGFIALISAGEPTTESTTRTRKLNQFMFERAKQNADVSHFVSRYTRGGIFVPRTHQLFIAENLNRSSRANIETRVATLLKNNNEKIIKEGRPISNDHDCMKELEMQYDEFDKHYLTRYEKFGLLG